jgi:hypothetical protein
MNKIYILLIIIIILLIAYNCCIIKEGFTISENEKTKFINKKNLNTPNTIYNIKILEDNISETELNTYMITDKWLWNKETTNRYETAFLKNPFTRTVKKQGINNAKKIYPQYAINYILDQQIEADNKRKQYEDAKKVYQQELYPTGIGIFGFNSGLF